MTATPANPGVWQGRPRPQHQPRRLDCPNCAGPLQLMDEHSELVVCPSCGSHLDATGDLRVLVQGAAAARWSFPLEIGASYHHQGHRYEVIARLALTEDGDDNELTRQYYLYNPCRGSFWLSEYGGQWDRSSPTRVMPASDPFGMGVGGTMRTMDGRSWRKRDGGEYTLAHVDGALPWQARIGDRSLYAEFEGSGGSYEAQRIAQEIEYGFGVPLSVSELATALGQLPTGALEPHRSGGGSVFKKSLLAMAMLLVLLVVGLVGLGFVVSLGAYYFGSLPETNKKKSALQVALHKTLGTRLKATEAALETAAASDPELLGPDAARWKTSLAGVRAGLAGGTKKSAKIQQLLKQDRYRDLDTLKASSAALRIATAKGEATRASVEQALERLLAVKKNPKPAVEALESVYAKVASDRTELQAQIAAASSRWPRQAGALKKEARPALQAGHRVSTHASKTGEARRAALAGRASGKQLRQLAVGGKQLQTLAREAYRSHGVLKLIEQLHWSMDTVLSDMKIVENPTSLQFLFRLTTVRIRILPRGEKLVAPIISAREQAVSKAVFKEHLGHLGMLLWRKPAGQFDDVRLQRVEPPGYALACAPGRRWAPYGKWQGKHWEFAPAFAPYPEATWPRGHRLTSDRCRAYRKAISRRRTFLDADASGRPAFGSKAAGILALYAASLYVREGGYNVPAYVSRMQHRVRLAAQRRAAAERRRREAARRAESYRRSSSSGSRSYGGK